ncbi:uncharacterized protein LOC129756015 [Uranotaenia lowii]|uniref:uncharacterized protein LOC129756014 n=1 Tax=Uranotaenia lowii TaxID=190385 RepID=UPI00247ABF84|nr:uncharacterized protein LOC129756014 [Uranotaenia lowii]XP_055608738.1 uncharacterized protein LOC129756015 [Uranotaenia lowii]
MILIPITHEVEENPLPRWRCSRNGGQKFRIVCLYGYPDSQLFGADDNSSTRHFLVPSTINLLSEVDYRSGEKRKLSELHPVTTTGGHKFGGRCASFRRVPIRSAVVLIVLHSTKMHSTECSKIPALFAAVSLRIWRSQGVAFLDRIIAEMEGGLFARHPVQLKSHSQESNLRWGGFDTASERRTRRIKKGWKTT